MNTDPGSLLDPYAGYYAWRDRDQTPWDWVDNALNLQRLQTEALYATFPWLNMDHDRAYLDVAFKVFAGSYPGDSAIHLFVQFSHTVVRIFDKPDVPESEWPADPTFEEAEYPLSPQPYRYAGTTFGSPDGGYLFTPVPIEDFVQVPGPIAGAGLLPLAVVVAAGAWRRRQRRPN